MFSDGPCTSGLSAHEPFLSVDSNRAAAASRALILVLVDARDSTEITSSDFQIELWENSTPIHKLSAHEFVAFKPHLDLRFLADRPNELRKNGEVS